MTKVAKRIHKLGALILCSQCNISVSIFITLCIWSFYSCVSSWSTHNNLQVWGFRINTYKAYLCLFPSVLPISILINKWNERSLILFVSYFVPLYCELSSILSFIWRNYCSWLISALHHRLSLFFTSSLW